jgi:hypothetical protein
MKDFWHKVLGGNRQAMQKADQATVKALELTAPGACRADARSLYGKLQSGQILGAFSHHEREAIWPVILSCSADCLIPSFYGFFEDLNYLKGPVDCVMRLIKLLSRDTIFSALEQSFFDVNQTAD